MAAPSLTSLEMTAIGAVAGTFEVCVMQPTVAVKNAIQEGRPIPRAPAGLYRGLLVSLLTPPRWTQELPTTAGSGGRLIPLGS